MRLIYFRCPEVGIVPKPLARIDDINGADPGGFIHLHWLQGVQGGASSASEARRASDEFMKPIAAFVETGRLLLTIHEPVSRAGEVPFPDVEVELRERLVERSAAIHIMHGSTISAAAPSYSIPASRSFVVPHPLYSGVYPRFVGRVASRAAFGFDPATVVILCFGAMRMYKGFDRIVDLLPALRDLSGLDVRLVIAGPTYRDSAGPAVQGMIERARAAPHVTLIDSGVPAQDVQLLFESADVVALPYRYMHNSGVLMLGLTFEKVCVVPETPITKDTLRTGLVHQFDMRSDEDLLRSLLEAIGRLDRVGPLPGDFADEYSPSRIAGLFAAEVARLAKGPG
jgi:glycosyltransferase involved in cell wall biosynthesis